MMNTLSLSSRIRTSNIYLTGAVDRLRDNMRGELITPTDLQYETARKLWNGMIDKKPALIARCACVGDVISAVNFSKEHNLFLSIQGGGHNVAGTAIAEGGIVIDLSAMRNVSLDSEKRVAHAEGGCA